MHGVSFYFNTTNATVMQKEKHSMLNVENTQRSAEI